MDNFALFSPRPNYEESSSNPSAAGNSGMLSWWIHPGIAMPADSCSESNEMYPRRLGHLPLTHVDNGTSVPTPTCLQLNKKLSYTGGNGRSESSTAPDHLNSLMQADGFALTSGEFNTGLFPPTLSQGVENDRRAWRASRRAQAALKDEDDNDLWHKRPSGSVIFGHDNDSGTHLWASRPHKHSAPPFIPADSASGASNAPIPSAHSASMKAAPVTALSIAPSAPIPHPPIASDPMSAPQTGAVMPITTATVKKVPNQYVVPRSHNKRDPNDYQTSYVASRRDLAEDNLPPHMALIEHCPLKTFPDQLDRQGLPATSVRNGEPLRDLSSIGVPDQLSTELEPWEMADFMAQGATIEDFVARMRPEPVGTTVAEIKYADRKRRRTLCNRVMRWREKYGGLSVQNKQKAGANSNLEVLKNLSDLALLYRVRGDRWDFDPVQGLMRQKRHPDLGTGKSNYQGRVYPLPPPLELSPRLKDILTAMGRTVFPTLADLPQLVQSHVFPEPPIVAPQKSAPAVPSTTATSSISSTNMSQMMGLQQMAPQGHICRQLRSLASEQLTGSSNSQGQVQEYVSPFDPVRVEHDDDDKVIQHSSTAPQSPEESPHSEPQSTEETDGELNLNYILEMDEEELERWFSVISKNAEIGHGQLPNEPATKIQILSQELESSLDQPSQMAPIGHNSPAYSHPGQSSVSHKRKRALGESEDEDIPARDEKRMKESEESHNRSQEEDAGEDTPLSDIKRTRSSGESFEGSEKEDDDMLILETLTAEGQMLVGEDAQVRPEAEEDTLIRTGVDDDAPAYPEVLEEEVVGVEEAPPSDTQSHEGSQEEELEEGDEYPERVKIFYKGKPNPEEDLAAGFEVHAGEVAGGDEFPPHVADAMFRSTVQITEELDNYCPQINHVCDLEDLLQISRMPQSAGAQCLSPPPRFLWRFAELEYESTAPKTLLDLFPCEPEQLFSGKISAF
ncbi:hypothetical protein K432DRAFT_463876 [Lepidopterella palustris CBS 459.81]|uniref:Uncharacterized protein n=1 Tax=Lepidopterella palustris CBS 459.81 TaxID=1314670 RepID=A0A8E2EI48_9PEZI|nr:hypothetical protein K432DRAFT_463876 [Lepidopterella palustris CBS 459.81]